MLMFLSDVYVSHTYTFKRIVCVCWCFRGNLLSVCVSRLKCRALSQWRRLMMSQIAARRPPVFTVRQRTCVCVCMSEKVKAHGLFHMCLVYAKLCVQRLSLYECLFNCALLELCTVCMCLYVCVFWLVLVCPRPELFTAMCAVTTDNRHGYTTVSTNIEITIECIFEFIYELYVSVFIPIYRCISIN